MAQEVARRAALAIDNARLYREAREGLDRSVSSDAVLERLIRYLLYVELIEAGQLLG